MAFELCSVAFHSEKETLTLRSNRRVCTDALALWLPRNRQFELWQENGGQKMFVGNFLTRDYQIECQQLLHLNYRKTGHTLGADRVTAPKTVSN